jgi:hypothetical protein
VLSYSSHAGENTPQFHLLNKLRRQRHGSNPDFPELPFLLLANAFRLNLPVAQMKATSSKVRLNYRLENMQVIVFEFGDGNRKTAAATIEKTVSQDNRHGRERPLKNPKSKIVMRAMRGPFVGNQLSP